MPKVRFESAVGTWDHFNRSLKDKELPPVVEEQRLVLETAVKEAMALKGEQLRLQAEALGVSQRMRQTIARGQRAESRLRAYLKAEYGATSPELIKHGMKPRPRGRFRETPDGTLGLLPPAGATLPGETAAAEEVAEDAAGEAMSQEEPAALPGAAPEAPEPAPGAPADVEPVPPRRPPGRSRRKRR